MSKLSLIFFLFLVSSVKSQNYVIEWNTYVCGSEILEVESNTQAINDSLNVAPNPFVKRTSIFYSFSQNDTVSLTIYNVIGQTVISLLTNSIMPTGAYQDSLIMDSFSDGIYFVRLQLGVRKSLARKIIKTPSAGIEEVSYDSKIKIYPNPASTNLHIETKQTELANSEIQITNCSGQLIFTAPYSKSIDISKLSQGFYTLKITTPESKCYNSKFIKE